MPLPTAGKSIATSALLPARSVTVTVAVTAALLCALGVPLMTPLSTSRARPGGRLAVAA